MDSVDNSTSSSPRMKSSTSRKLFSCISYAFTAFRMVTYLLGSIFLLVGSQLRYSQCLVVGSLFFQIGCFLIIIGTLDDVWELRESRNRRETFSRFFQTSKTSISSNVQDEFIGFRDSLSVLAHRDVFLSEPMIPQKTMSLIKLEPLLNAILFLIGSLFFALGALYFFPHPFRHHPVLGSLLFLIGNGLFLVGKIWDLIRLAKMNIQRFNNTIRAANLIRVQTIVAILTSSGNTSFIFGCCFLLHDTHQLLKALTCFIVGSCFWIVSSSIEIFVLHRNFLSQKEEDERNETSQL